MKKSLVSAATFLLPLLLLGTARALDIPDMPPLKEGLWKIHDVTTDKGQPPQDITYSLCRDHAFDLRGRELAKKALPSCTNTSDIKLPGRRIITVSCKVSGTTITSKSTVTGLSDTHVRSETYTTYTPAFYGQTESSSVHEQTWVSACPAGMAAGDRILPTGQISRHH